MIVYITVNFIIYAVLHFKSLKLVLSMSNIPKSSLEIMKCHCAMALLKHGVETTIYKEWLMLVVI